MVVKVMKWWLPWVLVVVTQGQEEDRNKELEGNKLSVTNYWSN